LQPVHVTLTVAPDRSALVAESRITPSMSPFEAMTYGPTIGPPPPTGAAPAGWTDSLDASVMARARFTRPLPVCEVVPAGSAFRARRETITPFDAPTDDALSSAAAPATTAAEAEVPLTEPPTVAMPWPGAATKTDWP
jgi:hypothetical protein